MNWVKAIVKRSRLWTQLDEHMREVAKGSFIAFALKVLAAGLSFLLNVILARLLGPEGTGLYFLALTVITIAAVLGRLGLDNTLVRFSAANATVEDWAAIKGLYVKGVILVASASLSMTIILFFLSPWLSVHVFQKAQLTVFMRWMALAVLPLSLSILYAQVLQGLKRIRDSILTLSVLVPGFSLIGFLVLVPILGIRGAVFAYILATILTLFFGNWRWRKATPQLSSIKGVFETSVILQSSFPLFWVAIMKLILDWSSNIMLGIWATSADVGLFSVANRTAMLTNFTLVAVNSIAAPKFAALYRQGNLSALGKLARSSTKLMTLLSGPILLLFVVWPDYVMAIFGSQFLQAGSILRILAIGQFINVSTGSVGFLLMMCGHERLWRNNQFISVVLNLGLNVMLIPKMGIMGAAIATAAALSLQMLSAVVIVWHKLGIMTMPIPGIRAKIAA